MNVRDDADILTAEAIQGDVIALQAILHQHRQSLLGYVKKLMPTELSPLISPEDVLQDTCLQAFRGIRGFVPNGDQSMLRWLMTIARHHIVDLLRQQRATKRGGRVKVNAWQEDSNGVVALLETLAVYRRTPSASAAAHEITAALESSIDRLSPDQQIAIRLRHLDGVSAKEAAAKMNRTENAFEQLCHRGLLKLREELRSISIFV